MGHYHHRCGDRVAINPHGFAPLSGLHLVLFLGAKQWAGSEETARQGKSECKGTGLDKEGF